MKTLIVSAAKFEAAPLLASLEKKSVNFHYFETGIGPLEAAKSASQLETLTSDAHVYFLGSCGSFSSFKEPYLISAKQTFWMPAGIRTGISDFNEDWYPPISLKENPMEKKLPKKIILTSPEISHSNVITRKSLTESSTQYYENMELYPLAPALNKAKTLTTVLGVTNAIGPTARAEWKKYFKQISLMTEEYLFPLISP